MVNRTRMERSTGEPHSDHATLWRRRHRPSTMRFDCPVGLQQFRWTNIHNTLHNYTRRPLAHQLFMHRRSRDGSTAALHVPASGQQRNRVAGGDGSRAGRWRRRGAAASPPDQVARGPRHPWAAAVSGQAGAAAAVGGLPLERAQACWEQLPGAVVAPARKGRQLAHSSAE
jgi:hypothetical protein